MRLIRLTILALAAAIATSSIASAAEIMMAQAMLVAASDKPGKTSKKLSPYEPNLKAVLRFESYRLEGDATAQVLIHQREALDMGGGHKLEVEVLQISGDRVKARVKWIYGDKSIANTVMVLRRGTPAVLGGLPKNDAGEVLSVLVLLV